eukprot:CAMPEP_0204510744 /NCGR_PEP_ID=MMETSP0661-20131031/55_1 /ASSEMBLY_ACC=CAM_ASM_000606 /TAXON_ID=109239 /ORGANISM="Alexandrium margalefi, Strain AMGDE01CS-322" /LENGTH=514 /DNA_ID=CAMNT_0051515789 /DNA_START=1 /DNA_END=1546 /DNA_ORIENTATION=+
MAPSPVLPPVKKYMALKKLIEAAEKRCMGDMYGLPFPQTPEELLGDPKFGPEWMTKAFQKAGSLPKDNKVVRIVSGRRFEGGGSGPKALFEVEYEKPDEELDAVLFVKMPHPLWENQQQRFVEEGQYKFGDNWGGEISFYRFLSPHVPFPCPKYYFGDLSRESTEAILINACVTWPEEGKTEFGPYEVFPACGKCEDYTLPNPHEYYFAMMRRMGTFTGMAKAKKLGPELDKINWYNLTTRTDVNCTPGFPGTEGSMKIFIQQVVPHWVPAAAKEDKFLDKFVKKFAEVQGNYQVLADYLYGDELYMGLCHQNANTDNAYFFKKEDGAVDAGFLDWGSTAVMSLGSGFMGSTISALAEMLAEHDEGMVRIWADAYHATGAPKLDVEELLLRYRVSTCINAYGIFSTANQHTSPQGIQGSKAYFASFEAWNCDAIRANFGLKFNFSMIYNRFMTFFLKGDSYWNAVTQVLKKVKKAYFRVQRRAALADYPTAALRAAEKPEDHFAGPEEKKAEEA